MQRLGIADAAAEIGISPDTVRRRLKRGQLKGNLIGGRWSVEVPDRAPQDPQGLDKAVKVLESQLDAARDQLQAKDRQIEQLHLLMSQRALAEGSPAAWWKFWRR